MEADELGTVEITTTEEDLRPIPGMIDAEVVGGYRITNLERENFFVRLVYAADSVDGLRARTETILSSLEYRVVAPVPT